MLIKKRRDETEIDEDGHEITTAIKDEFKKEKMNGRNTRKTKR